MSDIVRQEPLQATERPREDDTPKVGEWYWYKDKEERWLGCIIHVGTNFVELDRAIGSGRYIHFNQFDDYCEREPNPDPLIEREVARHQIEANRLMSEVQELTRLLGVPVDRALPSPESEALTLHQTGATEAYKKALIKAKEKTLPELFKQIEEENEAMGAWMKVKLLPLQAEAKKLERSIDVIESRIFSVELYAGLTEEVKQITDGKPAPITEKIRLHQRQHYMDEECLAQYETGGMDYKNLDGFDKWLARKSNRDRILPHPRCIVAFRIRRNRKDREAVSLIDYFHIMNEEKWDQSTFLYIRNGEQLYRLETKITFEEKLFPDASRQVLDRGELWAKIHGPNFNVDDLITDAEYQGMLEDERKARQEYKRKKQEDPKEHIWEPRTESQNYKRFSPDTICFDKIAEHVAKVAAAHNRVALVLQGLLDRSPVLHPHPKWRLWTHDGFDQALELIYDDSRALTDGEKLDFETYRARLNASLKEGSITIGQDDAWARREADRDRNVYRRGRTESERYRTHYRPEGNPGPGNLARIVKLSKRTKRALFVWQRERCWSPTNYWKRKESPYIRCAIEVPTEKLFNVSAYTPGDFKIFFADPRTRAEYLKWAPFLLEAEEYHAGNRKLRGEG